MNRIKRIEPQGPVDMAVLPRQDGRPARCADGVRAETISQPQAVRRNPVNVRRPGNGAAVRADRMGGMVVGHD